MTKKISAILCVIAIIACLFSFAACSNNDKKEEDPVATSYVTMDINPSVEIVVDQNNKVMSVKAQNDDADVMLYGEASLEGLDLQVAADEVLDLAVKYGYLTEDNSTVEVSISCDTASVETAIKEKMQAAVDEAKSGVDFAISLATEGLLSVKTEIAALEEKYQDVSSGKYSLIIEAMAMDNTLTFDEAYNMSTKDLLAIVESGESEIYNYANSVYQETVAKALAAYDKAAAVAEEVAYVAAYGQVCFAGATNATSALDLATAAKYSNLGKKVAYYGACKVAKYTISGAITAAEYIKDVELDETVSQTIADKFGCEVKDLQNDDGKVTVESVQAYVNKLYKNASAEQKVDIQTKYGSVVGSLNTAKEDAVLSADFNSTITTALGTIDVSLGLNIDTSKLTVESAKDALAQVEAKEEELKKELDESLTEEELKTVNDAVAAVNSQIAEYKATLTQTIEDAKTAINNELKAAKEARAQKFAENTETNN